MEKALRILSSTKAPFIKKRQVMRNMFGDYREKMKVLEKKSAAGKKTFVIFLMCFLICNCAGEKF